MHLLVAALLLAFSTIASAQNTALLLFGGTDHRTFLGCLNCSPTDSTSVCNQFGSHGSPFSSNSIWNAYGQHGGQFSNTSPFNPYASRPPIIVDRNGNSYGHLTANAYASNRTRIGALVALADAWEFVVEDGQKAADAFCGR